MGGGGALLLGELSAVTVTECRRRRRQLQRHRRPNWQHQIHCHYPSWVHPHQAPSCRQPRPHPFPQRHHPRSRQATLYMFLLSLRSRRRAQGLLIVFVLIARLWAHCLCRHPKPGVAGSAAHGLCRGCRRAEDAQWPAAPLDVHRAGMPHATAFAPDPSAAPNLAKALHLCSP